MRKITITNEEVLASLKAKDELTKRINELTEKSQKIEEEYNQIISRLQREDEKVKPLMDIEKENADLQEYEQFSRVYLGKEGDEEGKAMADISNALEEFKIFYAERLNNSNTEKEVGDSGDDTEKPTESKEDSK